MVDLRKATLKDFENFKSLFEDVEGNYEWLLWNFSEDPNSKTEVENVICEYHELDEYFDLTEEKFSDMITSKDDFHFVVESDKKFEGIVIASYLARGIYKITCWNFYDVNNVALREISLDFLIKTLPRLKRLDVCATFPSSIEFLESNGFTPKGINHYFILDIEKS